jgi:pimeloyl-ACP methyl ester carboxylesterase
MVLRFLLITAALALGAEAAHASCPPRSTVATHVFAGGLCLVVNTFGREEAGPTPTLVVVVHGDISDGGYATYHAAFAKAIARPGVIAVALMRPGYRDAQGRASEGETLGRSDNYTAQVVNAVGGAVDALRRQYQARRVIYVGHSGGAAIGGVLIGRRPSLIDVAMLVSCPCDIAAWLRARGRPLWTRSLSPIDIAHRVSRATQVIAMTGENDPNTMPAVAEGYVAKLAAHGVPARFVSIAGAVHGFGSVEAAVKEELDEVLAR